MRPVLSYSLRKRTSSCSCSCSRLRYLTQASIRQTAITSIAKVVIELQGAIFIVTEGRNIANPVRLIIIWSRLIVKIQVLCSGTASGSRPDLSTRWTPARRPKYITGSTYECTQAQQLMKGHLIFQSLYTHSRYISVARPNILTTRTYQNARK